MTSSSSVSNAAAQAQAQLLLLQQQQLANQQSLISALTPQSSTQTDGIASQTTSSTDATYQQSPVAQTFQQLSQAIDAGNLSGAQQAYATLTQLLGSNSSSGYGQNGQATTSGSSNSFTQALSQIGSDLQSNNLSGAKQILATLQGNGSGGSGSAASDPSAPANIVTVTNPDGSITTVTTDADGNVTTSTQNASLSTGTTTATATGTDEATLQSLLQSVDNLSV